MSASSSTLLKTLTRVWGRAMHYATRNRSSLIAAFVFASLLAAALAYLGHTTFVSPLAAANVETELAVLATEKENEANREIERTEPQFRAEILKAVNLYEQARPMLPTSGAEVGGVLAQVQSEATRNGVTLSGLSALKPETKSSGWDKLYQREYPAVVTGTHAQVVRFFYAVSRLPRIVLITDFTETSLRQRVSVSFTLFAYNAPPPDEIPALPEGFGAGQQAASVPFADNRPQE